MFDNISRANFHNKYSNICFLTPIQATNKYKVYLLKQKVQSLLQASLSPILTLGAFLLFHHNQTQPPRFQCTQKTNGKVDKHYPSQQLTVNNYHETWNDYLSNLVIQSKVYEDGETIYFYDIVSNEYLQNLTQSEVFVSKHIQKQIIDTFIHNNDSHSIIQQIFNLEKKKVLKTKKMAAVCFSASSLNPQRYLPRVHIAALFFGIFYRSTDNWTIYKPIKGQYPSQEQLEQLDGIILSGSSFSVYEDVPQINKFMQMLLNAYKKNKKMNILGFCFGHQSIGYSFGGKVQKMPKQIVKIQNIKINTKKLHQLDLDWTQKQSQFLNGQQDYYISQFHGDEVVQVPQGFQVLGSSESCGVEMMASIDKRILSFQFHMQYTVQFAGAYELRLTSYNPKLIIGNIYHNCSKLKSCERNIRSILELRRISRNFLAKQSQRRSQ